MMQSQWPVPAASPSTRPLLEWVTLPNCRDCRELEELLAIVRPDFPSVEFREVAADSPRGRELSLANGILRFPVIVLEGRVIGIESVSEPELRLFLAEAVSKVTADG